MEFIKKNLKRLLKDKLFTGSFVLLAGSTAANFGNYLYHLLMGRMLGPVDYGILASLISLTYLFGIPISALTWVVVKYVSAWRGKKDLGSISFFYNWLNGKLAAVGVFGGGLLIVISPYLASFLHLESVWPIVLVVIFSLIGVFLSINTAILQAFLLFGLMSALGIIQAVIKLAVGVMLVFLGGKVLGAIAAFLISSIVACLLTIFFVVRLLKRGNGKQQAIESREIILYAVPVFLSTLAFTSFYTTDVILARHFLPALEAGFYASLATLGKIIFFIASPIIMVMFPMVSERHAENGNYFSLLAVSLGLVFLVCIGLSAVYLIFPSLMIRILFGSEYLAASRYLFAFAVFLSFYSLVYLLVNFYLSIRRVKIVILPLFFAVVQVVMISLFHKNISQIVWISAAILSLLLILLLVYSLREYAKDQKRLSFGHRPGL